MWHLLLQLLNLALDPQPAKVKPLSHLIQCEGENWYLNVRLLHFFFFCLSFHMWLHIAVKVMQVEGCREYVREGERAGVRVQWADGGINIRVVDMEETGIFKIFLLVCFIFLASADCVWLWHDEKLHWPLPNQFLKCNFLYGPLHLEWPDFYNWKRIKEHIWSKGK